MGIGDWDGGLGMRMGSGIGDWKLRLGSLIWDKDWGLEWRLRVKLAYRLKIILEFEVYWIGREDAGFIRKYSQLNLTFLDDG